MTSDNLKVGAHPAQTSVALDGLFLVVPNSFISSCMCSAWQWPHNMELLDKMEVAGH